jgi:hypothetical protein
MPLHDPNLPKSEPRARKTPDTLAEDRKQSTVSLSLDDCQHCACSTELSGYTKESALKALTEGSLGCENCLDDLASEGLPNDGHTTCVSLYEGETLLHRNPCPRQRPPRSL